MPFARRGPVLGLLLTISILVSFSHPASDQRGLVIQPEAFTVDAGAGFPERRTVAGTAGPRTLTLRATGYNSLPEQTSGNPHVTATGAQTQFGIIAASRDLIGSDLPYGSLVRIRDGGGFGNGRGAGTFQELLDGHGLFIVEDTMHIRKTEQIDVWFPELSTALSWGVREVELEVIRHGRDGLVLEEAPAVLRERPAFTAHVPGN